MKKTAAALAISVGLLVSTAPPTEARPAFVGAVTKKECVKTRLGMTKKYVEKRLYKAKGFTGYKAKGHIAVSYRASKKWDPYYSGVGVVYKKKRGKWRVSRHNGPGTTCIFVPRTRA